MPHGTPDAYTVPGLPCKVLQTRGETAILFEEFHTCRQIHADGWKLSAVFRDAPTGPSVAAHSVGPQFQFRRHAAGFTLFSYLGVEDLSNSAKAGTIVISKAPQHRRKAKFELTPFLEIRNLISEFGFSTKAARNSRPALFAELTQRLLEPVVGIIGSGRSKKLVFQKRTSWRTV